jgi:hypothetical protein
LDPRKEDGDKIMIIMLVIIVEMICAYFIFTEHPYSIKIMASGGMVLCCMTLALTSTNVIMFGLDVFAIVLNTISTIMFAYLFHKESITNK